MSEMSFSDTSSEREINQEEYIKQKILSCKCSECATKNQSEYMHQCLHG